MKLKRLAASTVVGVAAVAAMSAVAAGPAVAADGVGVWRPYGSTFSLPQNWRCGPTAEVASSVNARACGIRSLVDGTKVQAAVIVHNMRSSAFSTDANARLLVTLPSGNEFLRAGYCKSSGLASTSFSVCFGDTFTYAQPVRAYGEANGSVLGGYGYF